MASCFPIFAWRMARSQTRHFMLFGILAFTRERTVLYGHPAYAAHDISTSTNESLQTYFQTTLVGGFISFGMDLLQLTRALLVNATKGPEVLANEVKPNKNKKPDCESADACGLAVEGFAGPEDLPHMRAWIRRIGLAGTILFWVTITLGIVAGANYQSVLHSGAHTDLMRALWYVSTVIGLLLLVGLASGAVQACLIIPRVPWSFIVWIVLVAALASIVQ
ncbi:hypothetical protein C8T65DRAFT_141278 [Cerioporus squamosus]|nr:hypothetical protein C8T65DRAFT_141278 [Cerioporus squamosus]